MVVIFYKIFKLIITEVDTKKMNSLCWLVTVIHHLDHLHKELKVYQHIPKSTVVKIIVIIITIIIRIVRIIIARDAYLIIFIIVIMDKITIIYIIVVQIVVISICSSLLRVFLRDRKVKLNKKYQIYLIRVKINNKYIFTNNKYNHNYYMINYNKIRLNFSPINNVTGSP